MTSASPQSIFSQSRQDFRESWKLLKANYRAFLGTQLFTIGMTMITCLTLILFIWMFDPNFITNLTEDPSSARQSLWIVSSVGYLIITAYTNCQTGLAHDIMSSGDMFAEFKGTFTYFKSYWWKYILISILLGGLDVSISFRPPIGHPASQLPGIFTDFPIIIIIGIAVVFIMLMISFIWFVLWIHSLASINAQHSFFDALKESFRIFKANRKRVMSTWGLFFLIFSIPGIPLQVITTILIGEANLFALLMAVILLLWNIFVVFVGLPMRALLVTGLYNNVVFNRIPPSNKINKKR